MKRRQHYFDPFADYITTVYADVSTSEIAQTKCKSMNWIIYFDILINKNNNSLKTSQETEKALD